MNSHLRHTSFKLPLKLPWLRSLLKPLMPYFKEALSISLFTNLLALAVPIFTLQVYDRVVAHNATATLAGLAIGVVLALTFDFILRQSRSRLLQHVALKMDATLGRDIYRKFCALPLRTLEERPTAYWQTIFADMASLRAVISGPSAVLLLDIPFAILFMTVIAILAPAVAWLLLLIVPAFMALSWFSSKLQTAPQQKTGQTRDMLIAELISGRTTVKALMIDKTMQEHFESLHADSIQQGYKRGTLSDNFIALGQILSQLSTVIIVIVGALAIIDRDLTTGSLIATTMLTGRIIQPLNQMLSTWRQFATAKQAATRLDEFFGEASEREATALERPRPQGELIAEQVSYGYNENAPLAVKEVSFRISPSHMVGIVGRNGCGKTTLVKLLLGLYAPDKGRILLDGADIKQFSRTELSEWIGYVPQECFLFSGSIKENIAKTQPHAKDEQILAAAQLSGTDRFVSTMPEGYDTQVGESGYMLSGGQRQRIAIARALLRNPPVLLLDEVSNHLDTEAERALAETLQRLKENRTIILVTHSPMLLKACDSIIVMEKGHIAMAGKTDEIMAKISK